MATLKPNWISFSRSMTLGEPWGRLAIGPRPKKHAISKLFPEDSEQKFLLTLLSDKEGARSIAKTICKDKLDVAWLWQAMPNAKPGCISAKNLVSTAEGAARLIKNGGDIYIHCAAGIHRTGMVAYAILYALGVAPPFIWDYILQMREQTYDGVGEHRIEWVQQVMEEACGREAT